MTVPFPVRAVPGLAIRAWFTPPPIAARTIERDQKNVSGLQSFRAGDVSGYELGTGPLVLALHGWGGRPAQMTALARRIADTGHRVLVPQLPGHAGGEPTDIKKSAAAIGRLIDEEGQPVAVVAHSFAALVLRLAFEDRPAPKQVVLIAPALDVNDALDVFGERLGLFRWTRRGLHRHLESWDPKLWPSISSLQPQQLPGVEISIFHDPADDEARFARAAELAALRPDTTLHVVDGVGHNRILRDLDVVEAITHLLAS